MNQLLLPLGWPAAVEDGAFLVTPCNGAAANGLTNWREWPVAAALLTGPRKSGRTLLGRVFAARAAARVIDTAEAADEETVFHAWNAAQASGEPLLLIADAPPPEWQIALPDLRSRLAASPHFRIGAPDEALFHARIERGLALSGIDARTEAIEWLWRRIERSHLALGRAIEALAEDDEIRRAGRLSIPLVRATMARAGLISSLAEHESVSTRP